jgi:hypothetical protein
MAEQDLSDREPTIAETHAQRNTDVPLRQVVLLGRPYDLAATTSPNAPYQIRATGVQGSWTELRRIAPGSPLLKAWLGVHQVQRFGVLTDMDGELRRAEPEEYAGH